MLARNILAQLVYRSGLWRPLANRSAYRILMYHRVVSPSSLPYPLEPGMFVTPETFSRQCKFLKNEMLVLPLAELVELALARKPAPPRAVAITFDDGYRDFFEHALPALDLHGLPATVFLPTAFTGTERMFPYDNLAAELERARIHEEFREKLYYALADEHLRVFVDLLFHAQSNLLKREILSQTIARLKQLDRTKRSVILNAVAALSTPGFYPRTFMNWDEVRQSQEKGITFASHSHNHLYLDEQSPDEILEDTRISIQMLEKHGVAALDYYCFPNGNFTPAALAVLESLGIQAGIATGRVRHNLAETPIVLSRIGVHQDITGSNAGFALRLVLRS